MSHSIATRSKNNGNGNGHTTNPCPVPDPERPSLSALREQFLQSMRLRNCSQETVRVWTYNLLRFCSWCDERGVTGVEDLTPELLAAYRRHLFHHRQAKTNKPLKFSTRHATWSYLRRRSGYRGVS